MAINDQLTLIELAKRTNNGEFLMIAEALNQINEIMQDAVWVESNQAISHVGSIRTSLPSGTWRRFNKGIDKHASTTKQVTEVMGMLEDYSVVDVALAEISGNAKQFRSQEDLAFIEGMSQSFIGAIFYGDLSDEIDSFNGLAQRYDELTDDGVWNAGGSGSDTTSAWFIDWSPRYVHLIYPKGASFAGVQRTDLGQRPAYDASSKPFEAWWTHFKIAGGLYVKDARAVQRIVNIETTGSTNLFDEDLGIAALNALPIPGGGPGLKMYVNRTVKTQIDIIAKDKNNVFYPINDAFGRKVTSFRGVPIRVCEQILDTETALS